MQVSSEDHTQACPRRDCCQSPLLNSLCSLSSTCFHPCPQYAAPFKLGWRDAVALIVLGGLVYSVQGILR